MKYFPLLLFFALTFAFAASAQTNQTSSCPGIDVTGGDEIVQSREPQTFTVKIEKFDLTKLSFKWTTSNGDIIEGQGTQSIKVSEGDNGKNTTVTVEIEGLPAGCPNSDSETGATICYGRPILFDEFSILPSRIEKSKLDNLVEEVGERPDSRIYIVEYFKRGTQQKVIDRKIQKITDYLVYEKLIAKDRFTILTADSEWGQHRTKFWIVPPGTSVPQP
jgi:hypothetical protein